MKSHLHPPFFTGSFTLPDLRRLVGLPDGAAAVVRPAERRHLATPGVGGASAPHGSLGRAEDFGGNGVFMVGDIWR